MCARPFSEASPAAGFTLSFVIQNLEGLSLSDHLGPEPFAVLRPERSFQVFPRQHRRWEGRVDALPYRKPLNWGGAHTAATGSMSMGTGGRQGPIERFAASRPGRSLTAFGMRVQACPSLVTRSARRYTPAAYQVAVTGNMSIVPDGLTSKVLIQRDMAERRSVISRATKNSPPSLSMLGGSEGRTSRPKEIPLCRSLVQKCY